jgi:hypothetical protein
MIAEGTNMNEPTIIHQTRPTTIYHYKGFTIIAFGLHSAREWKIVNETGYKSGLFWEREIGPSADKALKYCTNDIDAALSRRANHVSV